MAEVREQVKAEIENIVSMMRAHAADISLVENLV